MRTIERVLETILFQSRWLLAPFYLGLVFCLVLLMVHFGRELFAFVLKIPTAKEADVILGTLGLIDLAFTGNLVVIVVFSGYENFVSKIEVEGGRDRPDWMAKVDFGGLKQKMVASVGGLVCIHVLCLCALLRVVLADRWSEPPWQEKPAKPS